MKKRFLSFGLALLIMLAPMAAYAADSTKASTLRLEKTEGSVSLSNKNGKSLSIKEGAKLYNGNIVSTSAKSYAYISLDATKAVKLDVSSKAEVRQSGKKLEIDLKSGNLFFNVTVPLASDETLNIRTSTTITGVRGTAGVINVLSDTESMVYILNGSVSVMSTNPKTGASKEVVVGAGQAATISENSAVATKPLTSSMISGFVAQEIKNDTKLQEKIAEQTNLPVKDIADKADEKLKEDQQKSEQKQKDIEQKVEERKKADSAQLTNPTTTTPAPANPSGNSNSSGNRNSNNNSSNNNNNSNNNNSNNNNNNNHEPHDVISLGGKKYTSFKKAVADIGSFEDTVDLKLLSDINESIDATISSSEIIILDLNGYKLKLNELNLSSGLEITIKDSTKDGGVLDCPLNVEKGVTLLTMDVTIIGDITSVADPEASRTYITLYDTIVSGHINLSNINGTLAINGTTVVYDNKISNGGWQLTGNPLSPTNSEWTALLTDIANTSKATITLNSDVSSATGILDITRTVTLDLNGKTLELSQLNITSDGTTTVTITNGKIKGTINATGVVNTASMNINCEIDGTLNVQTGVYEVGGTITTLNATVAGNQKTHVTIVANSTITTLNLLGDGKDGSDQDLGTVTTQSPVTITSTVDNNTKKWKINGV